ncbi:TrmH family RNA methyltransferase [Nocardioides pocheonensis]|uniref:RNA methyltransferase n=1 Tax=Nocardioides pocheonensis TaxID=661485 RepID=A0A3N0GF31_9ACTN|nr:RNA methyltransferase [Nocardioides pocheonensis]RNM11059.1 RNA methyltransferase [Nocardioides pocheonensis]
MLPLTVGNSRVKEARKLSRRSVRTERRLFLADGPKAVEGALEAGRVVEVFATPDAARAYAGLLTDAPVTLVDDRALASLSDSVTPAGLVAVCRFLDVDLGALTGGSGPVVVCADVRDPGNAGTIIRTADAVAAAGVVLAGNSVDAYNEKTVRATVGSLFHVGLTIDGDTASVVARLQGAGYRVLAADGAGEVDLFDADELLTGKVAWLFGNEAWGLPADLAALADHRVAIPILGRAESLNLATAAAVCLYASAAAATRMGR